MRKTKLSTMAMLTLLIIASLSMIGFITNVEAKHEAAPEYRDVYWSTKPAVSVYGLIFNYTYKGRTYYNASLATTSAELYGDEKYVAFAVEANETARPQDDPIIRVDVIIPQDEKGNAYFHLVDSQIRDNMDRVATGWTSEIVEVDARGWPRSYRFTTSDPIYGIRPDGVYKTLFFCLHFSEGEHECTYKFTVWTHDTQQEGHSHHLWLNMDKSAPRIITVPKNGDTVNGLLAPCGAHYFRLNVTAIDNIPTVKGVHDSGIKNATIKVYNATNAKDVVFHYVNSSINIPPGSAWIFLRDVDMSGRASGKYNITVEVWDGVGNKNSTTITFTYVAPPTPLTITPASGSAAPTTEIANSATGLVKSTPETYKGKVLGTLVTVTGLQFGANLPVSIRVHIPTYHDYYATYGTYNILVNQTTTKADSTFTATFVFPKAPAGIYNVTAKTSVMECSVWFEVKPEIIYEPDEVIGPAPIKVKATGFTAQTPTSWIFILPDALQGVNTQIDRWWYIDGNGTLQNSLNMYGMQCSPPETIANTLNWPFLQPGSYTVEIKHVDGDYWDGRTGTWNYTPCFAGSNIIKVKNTLNLLPTIEEKLDELKPIITRIDGNVITINTTVGQIKATLDELKPIITRIEGNVANISTSVGADLTGKVDTISGTVATIETKAGNIEAQVPGLTTPIYIAAILSLIAAIAAIACALLVHRKIA